MVALRGPGRIPVWGETREYSWYIREGFFVRSPVTANGVTVPEEERVKYENEYFERAKRRDARERSCRSPRRLGRPPRGKLRSSR